MIKYKLMLDVKRLKTYQLPLEVKQGDQGSRFVHAILINDGVPINLENTIATFFARKKDETIVFNRTKIENGEVIFELTSQVLAVEGMVDCELVVYSQEGYKLTSATFKLDVIEKINDDEAVESTNEYTQLTETMIELVELVGDVTTNEDIREENENIRQGNETERKYNEEERKDKEAERKSNELERESNEADRQSNNEIIRGWIEDPDQFKGEKGNGLEYNWQGTELGIRVEGEDNYDYTNLKGEKGDKGDVVQIEIPEGSDLNDYTNVGFYKTVGKEIVDTIENRPFDSAFSLIVMDRGSSNNINQIALNSSTGSPEMKVRSKSTNWGEWRKLSFYDELDELQRQLIPQDIRNSFTSAISGDAPSINSFYIPAARIVHLSFNMVLSTSIPSGTERTIIKIANAYRPRRLTYGMFVSPQGVLQGWIDTNGDIRVYTTHSLSGPANVIRGQAMWII